VRKNALARHSVCFAMYLIHSIEKNVKMEHTENDACHRKVGAQQFNQRETYMYVC